MLRAARKRWGAVEVARKEDVTAVLPRHNMLVKSESLKFFRTPWLVLSQNVWISVNGLE